MLAYPVEFEDHPDGVILTFPDVPGSLTDGDSRAEALAHAHDALITILGEYMARRKDIPPPSAPAGRPVVTLSTRVALKLALYTALRTAGLTQAELAERIGVDARQVRRMLDLDQAGLQPDVFDAAFRALGKAVEVEVRDAA